LTISAGKLTRPASKDSLFTDLSFAQLHPSLYQGEQKA
jgi:hypothetical protein